MSANFTKTPITMPNEGGLPLKDQLTCTPERLKGVKNDLENLARLLKRGYEARDNVHDIEERTGRVREAVKPVNFGEDLNTIVKTALEQIQKFIAESKIEPRFTKDASARFSLEEDIKNRIVPMLSKVAGALLWATNEPSLKREAKPGDMSKARATFADKLTATLTPKQ